jgi:hypothetical protein
MALGLGEQAQIYHCICSLGHLGKKSPLSLSFLISKARVLGQMISNILYF